MDGERDGCKAHQEAHDEEDDADHFEFTAPDAQILIVDDNAINLTVTEGLLKPLGMQIDTCLSGKEAIEKISSQMYDIIFMDHMMPQLDGVETCLLYTSDAADE